MKLAARVQKPLFDWQLQLINVVFLLLMAFLANGTISNIRDATIELPSSLTANAGPVAEAAYLDAKGVLKFRGKTMTARDIAASWLGDGAEAGDKSSLLPLQIVADRHLAAASLVRQLQEFRAAGISNISLITVRE